jgi:hypothetical protein
MKNKFTKENLCAAYVEGYKYRAINGGHTFDESSKMYAEMQFEIWFNNTFNK